MTEILCFTRNRCATVELVDERTTRAACRVQDSMMEAWVQVLVRSPDLDITEIKGEIKRFKEGDRVDISEDLQKVIGTRVGPGIKKIIRGLLRDSLFVEPVSILLDECCNGVIMSFTKDILVLAPKDREGEKEFFASMVRANPRLLNSCAALSQDSPLMDALELDK